MIIKKNKRGIAGNSISPETEEQLEESLSQQAANQEVESDINLFDLDNIDFKQRSERRRGDRRRGFRRIDDRNLISRAREEAVSIRESAYKEGYQQGLEKAEEDISNLRSEIDNFMGAKDELFDEIAPDILDISLDIAKKIIKKEVTENPESVLSNIKEILKDLSKEETKIMLKVNPSQAAFLKERVPEEVNSAGLEAKVMIMPDEDITEGGCILTTTNGVIDATIETQIGIIAETLKEV